MAKVIKFSAIVLAHFFHRSLGMSTDRCTYVRRCLFDNSSKYTAVEYWSFLYYFTPYNFNVYINRFW